jgi:hypothetical protein
LTSEILRDELYISTVGDRVKILTGIKQLKANQAYSPTLGIFGYISSSLTRPNATKVLYNNVT